MIQASGHVLYVPEGAVSQPTKFKIRASKAPIDNSGSSDEMEVRVEVDLSAYTVDRYGNEIADIGAAGFLKPVYVGLAYSWVSDVIPDLTKANILWVRSETEVEPTRTFSVDYNGKWIVAELDHFSRYALGWPD